MQKAYFPMDVLRITQGENGSTSHKGSLALDLGGRDAGKDKVFAPCDMKIVRARTDSSHETYAESIEPVLWADGTEAYINFTFMHDDYLNGNNKAGAIVKQGEHFFDEGGFGRGQVGKFGAHLHLEVGRGKSPAKQVQNSSGTWVTPGQVHAYHALWLRPGCVVKSGGGYPWKRDEESEDIMIPIENTTLEVVDRAHTPEYFRTPNTSAPAGVLQTGVRYPVTAQSLDVVGGHRWVTLQLVDGTGCYYPLLEGRYSLLVLGAGEGETLQDATKRAEAAEAVIMEIKKAVAMWSV